MQSFVAYRKQMQFLHWDKYKSFSTFFSSSTIKSLFSYLWKTHLVNFPLYNLPCKVYEAAIKHQNHTIVKYQKWVILTLEWINLSSVFEKENIIKCNLNIGFSQEKLKKYSVDIDKICSV